VELCSIKPDVQSRIWNSVIHISCDEFSGTGIVIDKTDTTLYILTNLHLLGNDKEVLSHVSKAFKIQSNKYNSIKTNTSKPHGSKNKRKYETDPIKIKIKKYSGATVLEYVSEFVLNADVCWEASYSFDFMIFKVDLPVNCQLEMCGLGVGYWDTLPVHIFGFPGMLVADKEFKHEYAVITAQITGKDYKGHMILSTLSTPGLSGSAVVCTGRGLPIGYLGGGFDTSINEQYQCYGYGLEFVPKSLPRFLSVSAIKNV
jgi:hypothetical protein